MRRKIETLLLSLVLGIVFTIPCAAASGSDAHPDTGGAVSKPHPRNASKRQKPNKKRRKKKNKKHRGCDTRVDASYKKMLERLQRVPRIPGPRYRYGYRNLVLNAPSTGERVRFFPFKRNGKLSPIAHRKIRRIFKDHNTGAKHDIDPRIIKLLYKLADHFEAKQITIISGYRETRVKGGESRHSEGKAVDFILPGVPLEELVTEARKLGHVGVGYYPASYFVHLDVRKRASVFWVDPSGPKKNECRRRIMKKAAARYDRRWTKEDDKPEPHWDENGVLLGEKKHKKQTHKRKGRRRADDNRPKKGKPHKFKNKPPSKAPNISPY